MYRELYNDASVYFYLRKFYSEHNTRGPTSMSVWHRLHCYSTGLICLYAYIFCRIFTTWFLLVLYLAYIAHNAISTKEISTKCNVFLQLVILRPHPHFTRHVRKKIRKTIRILHIWKSADPHIRILPEALAGRPLRISVTALRSSGIQSKNRPIFIFLSISSLVLKLLQSPLNRPTYSTLK